MTIFFHQSGAPGFILSIARRTCSRAPPSSNIRVDDRFRCQNIPSHVSNYQPRGRSGKLLVKSHIERNDYARPSIFMTKNPFCIRDKPKPTEK
ncbi:hypothetical protein E1A91_A04G065800v1 [Gossypium mustelinum]|uniref:Uncharacterized protein n=3 Tax=Gossypium TaxID=3633 RepID=A0A5D2ZL01_GOSMU|nr:hypothetical protein E1A91_A04G065800v1 [Gossypium mustelinum]